MELLAILIALALYGLWGTGGPLQGDGWFAALRAQLARSLGGSALQVVCVLAPALLAGLLYAWIDDALFGIVALVLLVAVLLYSFGRGNLGALLAAYLERWSRGDFHAAWRVIDGAAMPGEDTVGNPGELHALARREYYRRAYERCFAVLFWFVLLGPAGALGYRLAALEEGLAAAGGGAGSRLALLHWLDWVPVRLLAISFALVGDFDAGLYRWRALLDDRHTGASQALEDCGNAALRIGAPAPEGETPEQLIARGAAELDAVEVMHRRALLVWLVVIALLAMIG